MNLRHLGYACINNTLGETTNHTLRLANIDEASIVEVCHKNFDSLERMILWNAEHGIHFLRIGSSMIPFASHDKFPLDDWTETFSDRLQTIADLAMQHDQRLSMHPGQHCVLNSTRDKVIRACERELDYAARFLDATCPDLGTITLHVGGMTGGQQPATARAIESIEALPEHIRARLTLENDDKIWRLEPVLDLCEALGLPLVFDIFHQQGAPLRGSPGLAHAPDRRSGARHGHVGRSRPQAPHLQPGRGRAHRQARRHDRPVGCHGTHRSDARCLPQRRPV